MKMSDFDLILIKEYEKRHGLYDQNSPYYKDKYYSDNAWREISMVLNCNVSMLKVRMIQLRCRYNNEKRKFDFIKRTQPDAFVTWPLFDHLTFLNGHIKQRKRYKNSSLNYTYPGSLEECSNEFMETSTPLINPIARRRGRPPKNFSYAELPEEIDMIEQTMHQGYEEEVKNESPSHSGASADDDEPYVNSANFLAQPAPYTNPDSASDLKNTLHVNKTLQNQINGNYPNLQSKHSKKKRKHHENDYYQPANKFHRHPDKYSAFGQFVTAALTDMAEEKALNLIEGFTVSLVKTMKENQN